LRSSNTYPRRSGKRGRTRTRLVCTALIFCLGAAHALDPARGFDQYVHDRWGTDRGFVGGAVYCMAQTPDGYLWIGTDRGLVRFDGFNFTLIQHPIPSLPPIDRVWGMVRDGAGNLWIRLDAPRMLLYRNGEFHDVFSEFNLPETTFTAMTLDQSGGVLLTGLGSAVLQFREGAFHPIANSTEAPGTITSIAQSRDGRIWMGTRDGGLYVSDHGKISNGAAALPSVKINTLLPALNGGLWIGTDHGIRFLTGAGLLLDEWPAWVHKRQILAMATDAAGNTWAGTDAGLIRITTSGQAVYFKGGEAPGHAVTSIYEDHDDNLWFGGQSGLERLQNGAFTTWSAKTLKTLTQTGPVYADDVGRTWFAPVDGGLYWLKNSRVQQVRVAGLDKDVVYSIDGGGGEVWVGRQRGGLTRLVPQGDSFAAQTFTQKEGLPQNSIYSVHRARNGTVWAGTVSGGVVAVQNGKIATWTRGEGFASNAVSAIAESHDRKIWVATPTGLMEWDGTRWKTWGLTDGLPSEDVRTCSEDSREVLWAATADGLAFQSGGRFHGFENVPDPLREQIVGIAEDGLGFLWFSTPDRVLRANRESLISGNLRASDIQAYGRSDGLIGFQGIRRDHSMVADAAGRIWVSVGQGIAVADPRLSYRDILPVHVRVDSLVSNGSDFLQGPDPKIPAGRKNVTFHFASDALSAPERIRFRYRLDGADQDWSEPVDSREVSYNNLEPGPYRFHVIGSRDGSLWNGPESAVSFSIDRAYWQTWWFRLGSFLAFVSAILLVLRFRTVAISRQLNARYQERLSERTRIARELHDTLLQSFQGLMLRFQTVDNMLPANPATAKHVLGEALDRADEAIRESREAIQNIRPASARSPHLRDWLNAMLAELREEYARDAGAAPEYEVIVEGGVKEVNPNTNSEIQRIAQEALRNSFQHARANKIEVEVIFRDAKFRMRFRDDGVGIDAAILERGARAGHWGLMGMRERSASMGGHLEVWSKPGAGTEIELIIPGITAYDRSSTVSSGIIRIPRLGGRHGERSSTDPHSHGR